MTADRPSDGSADPSAFPAPTGDDRPTEPLAPTELPTLADHAAHPAADEAPEAAPSRPGRAPEQRATLRRRLALGGAGCALLVVGGAAGLGVGAAAMGLAHHDEHGAGGESSEHGRGPGSDGSDESGRDDAQAGPGANGSPRGGGPQGARPGAQSGGAPAAPGAGGPGSLPGGALHAESTTVENGTTVTVVRQSGEVTAVTDTSITVRSTDGYEQAYAIDASTQRPATAPAVGDQVVVTGTLAGDARTATEIRAAA
ncbi:hypothetical protein [Brachybacterium huguangmaarense]